MIQDRRFHSTALVLGILALVSLSLSVGCETLAEAAEDGEVSSDELTGGSGSSGGSGDEKGAGESIASAAQPKGKRIRQVYANFTREDCVWEGNISMNTCKNMFAKKVDLDEQQNPRQYTENPDPKWLPGWEKLPAEHGFNEPETVYKALVAAKLRKLWAKQCNSDFEKLWTRMKEAESKIQKTIEKSKKQETPYGRISMLINARSMFTEDLPPFLRRVGPRYTLETAILDAFQETDREFVYWKQGLQPRNLARMSDELAVLRPHVDKELERIRYCHDARDEDHAPETRSLLTYGASGEVDEFVRPVISQKQYEKAASAMRPKVEAYKERFSADERTETATLLNAEEGTAEDLPVWVSLTDEDESYELQSIEQEGDATVVRLRAEIEDSYVVRGTCKTTDKVQRVRDDGSVVYQKVCEHNQYTEEKNLTIRIPNHEIPAEKLPLEKGDGIEFWGRTLDSSFEKVRPQPNEHRVRKVDFELLHLHQIERDGETVWGPFF